MFNKKYYLITLLLAVAMLTLQANEVNVLIVNKSEYSIYGNTSQVKNGSFLVNDHGTVSPAEVKKGSTASFGTGQALPFCGTDGYVSFKATANGKVYYFTVNFDVPYIGSNEFTYYCDAPFRMKHVVGGPGSNVTITFELTGGPAAIEPLAPPVVLQTSGTAWLQGSINWNSNIVGMPEGNILDAFDFVVVAPSKFYPNYPANNNPNFTSGSVSPTSGTFTDYKPIASIKVKVSKNEISSNDRFSVNVYANSLNYVISNLPNGIPLEVRVTPKDYFWQTGNATPPKPVGNEPSKWTVFTEIIKTDNATTNFKVNGIWLNAQGKATGGDNGVSNLGRQLLRKEILSIKNDVTIFGDNILKIPGVENKKIQKIDIQKKQPVQKIIYTIDKKK